MVATSLATRQGSVVFAKNSDRDYREAQHLLMVGEQNHPADSEVALTHISIPQISSTNAVLLSKPHWIWGAEIGTNAHGLTIGNEALFSTVPASDEPGIIGMDYIRLALERASSVDEAIDVIIRLLERYGQGGNCGFSRPITYHNAFLLADENGAKVLETVGSDWAVRMADSYDAISNGFTIDTGFDCASNGMLNRAQGRGKPADGMSFSVAACYQDPVRIGSSAFRRRRALSLLEERRGELEAADFMRILRDHADELTADGKRQGRICAHKLENPIGQTTASWVSDLRPGRSLHWVTGTAAACTSIFKPLFLGTILPPHGPQPGAKEDVASLWWHHERLRQQLDHAGGEALSLFHAERDALESDFLFQADALQQQQALIFRRDMPSFVATCWDRAMAFEKRWEARLKGSAVRREGH